MYQVINKETNEVVAEAIAYSPLEDAYKGLRHKYFLKNAQTGVEWELPED